MESFETNFEEGNYFEEIAMAFSEDNDAAIDFMTDEINVCDNLLSSSDMIDSITETFEKNAMNEHLATIDLLGDLGYTDMLMYYSAVMDCLAVNGELEQNEKTIEIATPSQYIEEKDTLNDQVFEVEIEASRNRLTRIIRILNYLKNKEYKILSNTFYTDGSDFVLLLRMKSVAGYNLKITIVFKCNSSSEAIILEERFKAIQPEMTDE